MRSKLIMFLITVCVCAAARAETRGVIRGIVLDSEGKPVAKARVLASEVRFTLHRVLQFHEADSEGRFSIDNLRLGTYLVSAGKEDEGYPEMPSGFYGYARFPSVVLQPDSLSATVTIHLLPKAGAIGPVFVADALTGEQVTSAAITLSRLDAPNSSLGASATQPSILVPSNVDVSIEITASGYKPWPRKGGRKDEGHIRLKPEQAVKLDVKLAPEGSTANNVGVFSPAPYTPGSNIVKRAAEPGNPVLSAPVEDFIVAANDISAPLKELARRYRVSIGFQASPEAMQVEQPVRVRIDIRKGTVRDVLNAITAADPAYAWEESSFGAIAVFPKDRPSSLLDVLVSKYSVANVGPQEAINELLKTPEVQRWMVRAAVRYEHPKGAATQPTSGSGIIFRMDLKNAQVRSILNAIATSSRSNLWVYRPGNQSFALSPEE